MTLAYPLDDPRTAQGRGAKTATGAAGALFDGCAQDDEVGHSCLRQRAGMVAAKIRLCRGSGGLKRLNWQIGSPILPF